MKVKAYIARHKDGTFSVFRNVPTRGENEWRGNYIPIADLLTEYLVSGITWETNPVEVEITIRKPRKTKN